MSEIIRVHVTGISPRTGTTLVYELLKAWGDFDCPSAHEITLIKPVEIAGKPILTKAPRDLRLCAAMVRLCPRLRVVVMVRDPRDVVCSQHGSSMGSYWVDGRIALRQAQVLRSSGVQASNQVAVLKYEDVVRRPSETRDRMKRWLAPHVVFNGRAAEELPEGSISPEARLAMGGVRPIDVASVGVWRSHLPRIKQQLDSFSGFGRLIEELGYEADCKWQKELDSVSGEEPMPTHAASNFGSESVSRRWWRRLRLLPRYANLVRSGGLSA